MQLHNNNNNLNNLNSNNININNSNINSSSNNNENNNTKRAYLSSSGKQKDTLPHIGSAFFAIRSFLAPDHVGDLNKSTTKAFNVRIIYIKSSEFIPLVCPGTKGEDTSLIVEMKVPRKRNWR
jgi:hypothetical protein